MDKIIEFFKKKLSIAASDELQSQYVDKITLIQSSIILPEVFTENIAEQLDAVLQEFGINIKLTSTEEIKNSCNIFKNFGLKILENNEDDLIVKLELITSLSKWHGFSSISKISEEKLSNFKILYVGLAGKELNNISYDIFNKVRTINLAPIKQLAKLDGEELKRFLEFCKSYGISANIEIADLTKTNELSGILGILRIENNWLEDANQKKLATLFKASSISKISDISAEYAKSISVIKKEFNFDFGKLSQLKLQSFIKLLSSLNIKFISTAEEIESTAQFISEFCKIEELNSYDAAKIAKIMEALGSGRRDKKETSQVIQLMKSLGIKFSLSEDFKNELGKIQKLSAILKSILNKEIAELSFLEIKKVTNLVETLFKNQIIVASEKDIEAIKKIFQLFPVAKEAKEFDVKKLQQILKSLEVEPKEISKLENLSSNLKKLNLDIWSLESSEAVKIKELFGYLDSSLTTETITEAKKERFIKIKEFLGADYHNRDIEKINKLANVIGKAKISELEVEEISKLKLIMSELGMDIKDRHISDIEHVADLLSGYDIKSVGSNQSTLSKMWSGEAQALKDKLSQIKEIFKKFGYNNLIEAKGQEKIKFQNLLELYKKLGFQDFTLEVSDNINKFLKSINLNFKELSSYKLKNITEGLKEIGIQLFESKENLEKYEYFLKEINLDLEKLNERTGSKISETLNLLRVDRVNIKEEVKIINDAINKLRLPNFAEIRREQVEKVKELGEAITGGVVELTPKVACNIAKILHWYKVAFELPASSDVKYHKPEEEGLLEKIKKLQAFKIDLTSNEGVEAKNNLIMYLSILYKDKCHKDTASPIDYEKELTAMMSLSSDKLADFIIHADSKKECLKTKDVTIGEECEVFMRGIETEMTQLCQVIHEDL